MADRFDVTARLDEGRSAVENTQSYVWACHLLGYQNPDLALHAAQVRDWYNTEDGLDLKVLDGDCAVLQAADDAIEEVSRSQRAQLAALAAAWEGDGAHAVSDFLRRHCDAADSAAAAVRGTADGS